MLSKSKKNNLFNGIIFLGPMLVLFFIIKALPLILDVYYSFTNWNGISSDFDIVGIKNYILMLNDSQNLDFYSFYSLICDCTCYFN